VDGAYTGKLIAWSQAMFGWLANYRRLNRDCETTPRQSEAMIQLAMVHLPLKRIA
jgi:transposase